MILSTIALYLAVGAFAGLIAGLFGVGGGLIIVPALIYTFDAQGFDSNLSTHLAIGTSLATICVTSLSSVYAHHQKGAVDWPLFLKLASGLMIGASAGAFLASDIAAKWLSAFIGLFAIMAAAKMWFDLRPRGSRPMPGTMGKLFAGIGIGAISALCGIGGGTLTVPFLSLHAIRMQNAIATSAACGFPIALSGAISYALAGLGEQALPNYSTGFLFWPAWFGVICCSLPMAKVGAQFAHKLPATTLKKSFALLLAIVGINFLRRTLLDM